MSNIRIAAAAFVAAFSLTGAVAAADLADGEVRKVDKDNKKLTIKHGPLADLDMPGMTMVFGVKEDALLDKVKTGEKVRFQAEKIDGRFVVTAIEPAP
jgi:Cu/Ag efflux protein CusF